MKYYFPIHLNGGNRGCEGIAKGTATILGEPKELLIGLCTDIPLDKKLKIDHYVTLVDKQPRTLLFKIISRIYRTILKLFTKDSFVLSLLERFYAYHPFIKKMNKGDIMLSTGGDMMCYGDNQVITTCTDAKRQGAKTILWGCSMGKENLTPRKKKILSKFDLIYARESLTYEFFKSLGFKKVVCYPDPAFALEPETVELPKCFESNKVIGINLSNYTVGAYTLDTPFGEEVKQLLDYILNETEYHILLIPHVMWNDQDDRIIAKNVADLYEKYEGRISVLDSDKFNYLQIRYIISKCHVFIGGRTHAVVSAYSTCVPAIALGYSIKSRGIAKDIGMPEYSVVDSKHIHHEGYLLDAFNYMFENEASIRKHLCEIMPEYRQRTYGIRDCIKNI